MRVVGQGKTHPNESSDSRIKVNLARHTSVVFFMNTLNLHTKFARMGARLKLVDHQDIRRVTNTVSLDVREDSKGEFFEIAAIPSVEIDVLDLQQNDRHLLLLVRETGEKSKYLCGHDERHWFVAGIPEKAAVGTVSQAKESLKPRAVIAMQNRLGLNSKNRNRRRNPAFIRQGEWFFIPTPEISIDRVRLLKNEPLQRGNGGKPHWVDYCYRTGGEAVYVCNKHPNGLLEKEYQNLLVMNAQARHWGWRAMRRNMNLFVKGRVRHADHATIILNGWHQVLMNTESESKAMRNVAFLD